MKILVLNAGSSSLKFNLFEVFAGRDRIEFGARAGQGRGGARVQHGGCAQVRVPAARTAEQSMRSATVLCMAATDFTSR